MSAPACRCVVLIPCALLLLTAARGELHRGKSSAAPPPAKKPHVAVRETNLGPVPTGSARDTKVTSPDNRHLAYVNIVNDKAAPTTWTG